MMYNIFIAAAASSADATTSFGKTFQSLPDRVIVCIFVSVPVSVTVPEAELVVEVVFCVLVVVEFVPELVEVSGLPE